MAAKKYEETSFGSLSGLPIDEIPAVFDKTSRAVAGESVTGIIEAPRRAGNAVVYLRVGFVLILGFLAFAAFVFFSNWLWSWPVAIGLAGLGLASLVVGGRSYYSLGSLQDNADLFFMSGKNLVPLVEKWWYQPTAGLRYVVYKKQTAGQFLIHNLGTKIDEEGNSIPITLVVRCNMSFSDQRIADCLREVEARAMSANISPQRALGDKLSQLSTDIRNYLTEALKPVVADVTYRELRAATDVIFKSGVGGLVVRNACNAFSGAVTIHDLTVVDILPPAEIAAQEERLQVKITQEARLVNDLESKISVAKWPDLIALHAEINGVDINDRNRESLNEKLGQQAIRAGREYFMVKVQAATVATEPFVVKEINNSGLPEALISELLTVLGARITEIHQAALAKHKDRVADRVADLATELDALLEISDPEGELAAKMALLAARREQDPNRVESALLIRQMTPRQLSK